MDLSSSFRDEMWGDLDLKIRSVRRWLLYFFGLTMPMVIFLGNTEYGYTKTIYTFLYISFLVLLWGIEILLSDKPKVYLSKLRVPVVLLVCAGLLSLINATSKLVVLQSLALLIYFYLIFFLIVNTIDDFKSIRYYLYSLITSGFGAAIYGLLQFIGVAKGPYGLEPGLRSIISTLGNPNYLAGYLSYLFIPTFLLVVLTRSKLVKAILPIVLGLYFFLFFSVGARGVWLGLILGLITMIVGISFTDSWRALNGHRIAIALVLTILLIAYLLASAPSPLNSVLSYATGEENGSEWGILTPIIKPAFDYIVKEGGARDEDWFIAFQMFEDHPVFGIGLGNYKINFLDYREKFLASEWGEGYGQYINRGAQAHNEYLQFLAELGGLGIAIILFSIFYTGFIQIRRVWQVKEIKKKLLAVGLIAGVFGFLAHSVVSFPAHLPASSLVMVSFLGLVNTKVYGDPDLRIDLSVRLKYALVGIMVSAMIMVSIFAYRDWRANVLMGKGMTQMQLGNYRLAKETFLSSRKLDFQPRQTNYYLGLVERQLGHDDKALDYFKKSLDRFEPYKLFLQLGTLYLNKTEYKKSEYYLQKFLNMGPPRDLRLEANYFLATIDIRKDDLSSAKDRIERILKVNPEYTRGLILKGDIANYRGKVEKAREIWKQALAVIEKEISSIKSRVGDSVGLAEYDELRSRLEVLKEERRRVNQKLADL